MAKISIRNKIPSSKLFQPIHLSNDEIYSFAWLFFCSSVNSIVQKIRIWINVELHASDLQRHSNSCKHTGAHCKINWARTSSEKPKCIICCDGVWHMFKNEMNILIKDGRFCVSKLFPLRIACMLSINITWKRKRERKLFFICIFAFALARNAIILLHKDAANLIYFSRSNWNILLKISFKLCSPCPKAISKTSHQVQVSI